MRMPEVLTIVRHGTSEANDGHKNLAIARGHLNPKSIIDKPVYLSRLKNPDGVKEAMSAGEWLANNEPLWDAGYVSPFIRTIETASYLYDTDEDFWRIDHLLRERDWGELDIVPDQIKFDKYKDQINACLNGHWLLKPPGGESLIDVLVRVVLFNDILARRNAGQRILAVSHSEFIKAAMMYYLSWPLAEMDEFEKTWPIFSKPANCQIVMLGNPNQDGRFTRVRSVVPWDSNHKNNLDWTKIKPKRYNTSDLKRITESFPRHF